MICHEFNFHLYLCLGIGASPYSRLDRSPAHGVARFSGVAARHFRCRFSSFGGLGARGAHRRARRRRARRGYALCLARGVPALAWGGGAGHGRRQADGGGGAVGRRVECAAGAGARGVDDLVGDHGPARRGALSGRGREPARHSARPLAAESSQMVP